MSFWNELRRRNVIKVGTAYLIVAWLLAQVASVLAPALILPEWVVRFVVFLLALGLPVALLLAWAYELTPEGIKRATDVPSSESVSHATGRKLNHVLAGLLVLAVAYIGIDAYVLRERPAPAAPVTASEPSSATATANPIGESAAARPKTRAPRLHRSRSRPSCCRTSGARSQARARTRPRPTRSTCVR